MRKKEPRPPIQYKLIEQLRASEKRYRELIECIREIVFQCNAYGEILFLNTSWTHTLGYSLEESLRCNIFDFIVEEDSVEFLPLFQEGIAADAGDLHREVRLRMKSGTAVWFLLSLRKGNDDSYIGSLHDINDRKVAEMIQKELNQSLEQRIIQRTNELEVVTARLKCLSQLDGLTGIFNRRYFDSYLQSEFERNRRTQRPLTLIMCDLDFFKRYNDIYGPLAGDDCLKQFAALIRNCCKRPADIAARYGGEAFAIILPETDKDGASRLAEVIRSELEQLAIPHRGGNNNIVSVSIGVASLVPERKLNPDTIIAQADAALYRSKSGGRGIVTLWREEYTSTGLDD